MILCVFLRKLSHARSTLRAMRADGHDATPRRGLSQQEIDSLPRVRRRELAKPKIIADDGGADRTCGVTSPGHAGGMRSADEKIAEINAEMSVEESDVSLLRSGGGHVALSTDPVHVALSTDDDADGADVCAVCLSGYSAHETLIRLRCDHTFHEDCVARWLLMDGSCPECRAEVLERSPADDDAGSAASSTTRGADARARGSGTRGSGTRGNAEVQLELLEFARPGAADEAPDGGEAEGGRAATPDPERRSRPVAVLDV